MQVSQISYGHDTNHFGSQFIDCRYRLFGWMGCSKLVDKLPREKTILSSSSWDETSCTAVSKIAEVTPQQFISRRVWKSDLSRSECYFLSYFEGISFRDPKFLSRARRTLSLRLP
jgi:hypothetical protein